MIPPGPAGLGLGGRLARARGRGPLRRLLGRLLGGVLGLDRLVVGGDERLDGRLDLKEQPAPPGRSVEMLNRAAARNGVLQLDQPVVAQGADVVRHVAESLLHCPCDL